MAKQAKQLVKVISKMIGPGKRHSPAGKSYLKSGQGETDKVQAEDYKAKQKRKAKNRKMFEAIISGKAKVRKE